MKLKGHSKIELTDVNTGEVTVREQDNIFTNAIPNIYAHVYFQLASIPRVSATAGIKNWLGGVMLFDSAIDEDPNITMCPAGVKCVGHAAQDAYAGSDSYRGSVNSTETSITDTGATYVWDFATNQGNGMIACLALTSEKGGACGYGCSSSSSSSSSSEQTGVYVGTVASCGSLSMCQSTSPISQVYETDGINYSMYATFGIGGIIVYIYETTYATAWSSRTFNSLSLKKTLTDNTYASSSSTYEMYRAGIDGDYIYWFYVYSSTLYVVEVSKDFTTINVYASSTYSVTSAHSLNIVKDGILYSLTSSSTIYKNDFKNGTKEAISLTDQGITAQGGYQMPYNFTCAIGDKLYMSNIILDTSDDTVLYSTPFYYAYTGSTGYYYWHAYLDEKYSPTALLQYSSSSYYYYYPGIVMNYLATINNLETPVTKTSAQTMKITYTVTVED